MIRMLAKLLKVLNSENDPAQISLAFSFSMFSGFLPFFTPINLLVLFTVFALRVNLSAYLLGMAFFAGIAYILDPLFHAIGLAVLSAAPLEGIWTAMYNSTIWRIQKFNNSVVMGSFIFAVLFFVPLVLLSNMLIRRYREHVLAWVRKTKLMKMITASNFYQMYEKVSGWTGGDR
ncbi:MAG: hypothetical protein A2010_05060 [Nitrospirae bacterium GWD2_57_9]|nr:MAG: hypothetical protein A2010_05060 [Nitrospirae bacterium GWD2_57_9]